LRFVLVSFKGLDTAQSVPNCINSASSFSVFQYLTSLALSSLTNHFQHSQISRSQALSVCQVPISSSARKPSEKVASNICIISRTGRYVWFVLSNMTHTIVISAALMIEFPVVRVGIIIYFANVRKVRGLARWISGNGFVFFVSGFTDKWEIG
jgi:hypothetical protein